MTHRVPRIRCGQDLKIFRLPKRKRALPTQRIYVVDGFIDSGNAIGWNAPRKKLFGKVQPEPMRRRAVLVRHLHSKATSRHDKTAQPGHQA